MKTFTYSDSLAGMQSESFDKLSEITQYIEDFGHEGDDQSVGVIYEDCIPILMYTSSLHELYWRSYESNE